MSWWRNLSVKKKLYCVVGLMGTLIACELFTLLFAMSTLSAVRAYVEGEGLWSKAQKDAAQGLITYAFTKDRRYYQRYENHLRIPLGDRIARLELEKPEMNEEIVMQGFVQGQNHPDDVPGMIKLMRRFYWIPHLAKANAIWKDGDELIGRFMEEGRDLDKVIQANQNFDIGPQVDRITAINDQLTVLEDNFSSTLGEASRWLEGILMFSLVMLVLTVEGTGLLLTYSFGQNLSKQLKDLKDFARKVGRFRHAEPPEINSQDEIGQLADALVKMSQDLKDRTAESIQAEEASRIKSLFLANMSHEIRTPLSVILGFSELMRDKDATQEERNRYAGIVKRTGENLTRIVNDILDISKVEAGRLHVEPSTFSLNQLIRDLEIYIRLRFGEKNVTFSTAGKGALPETIISDPSRLRQILLNVVGNAMKFTEEGQVNLTYSIEGRHIVFNVKDTGVGITSEQKRRLFRSFSQGDSSIRRKYGGTGLGLILSRKLARLLGGDVDLIETKPGEGTHFRIKVAFEAAKEVATASPAQEKVPNGETLRGKNILVVEDIPENQLLINLYLSKSGARANFANNGLEGLRMVEDQKFDLILMDMQMPVMDGYTATSELRLRGFSAPIIALTGHAMKEDREKCLRVGCDAYLTKPIDRNTLVNVVSTFTQTPA
jgi:two-component system, sensor histidine kinase